MSKIKLLYSYLFAASILLLVSCSTETSIHGLWQETNSTGTIEFKTDGKVIIIDNTAATVTGTFERNANVITFVLTATDIMSDSIQPTEKTIVTANIVDFNADRLQLGFSGNNDIESYKRVR